MEDAAVCVCVVVVLERGLVLWMLSFFFVIPCGITDDLTLDTVTIPNPTLT